MAFRSWNMTRLRRAGEWPRRNFHPLVVATGPARPGIPTDPPEEGSCFKARLRRSGWQFALSESLHGSRRSIGRRCARELARSLSLSRPAVSAGFQGGRGCAIRVVDDQPAPGRQALGADRRSLARRCGGGRWSGRHALGRSAVGVLQCWCTKSGSGGVKTPLTRSVGFDNLLGTCAGCQRGDQQCRSREPGGACHNTDLPAMPGPTVASGPASGRSNRRLVFRVRQRWA